MMREGFLLSLWFTAGVSLGSAGWLTYNKPERINPSVRISPNMALLILPAPGSSGIFTLTGKS
jgi:hypothetical protein